MAGRDRQDEAVCLPLYLWGSQWRGTASPGSHGAHNAGDSRPGGRVFCRRRGGGEPRMSEVTEVTYVDHGPARRKDRRLEVRLPVEVRGIDRTGIAFDEKTSSENVCRQGAAFTLSHDLEIGSDVEIYIPLPRSGAQG